MIHTTKQMDKVNRLSRPQGVRPPQFEAGWLPFVKGNYCNLSGIGRSRARFPRPPELAHIAPGPRLQHDNRHGMNAAWFKNQHEFGGPDMGPPLLFPPGVRDVRLRWTQKSNMSSNLSTWPGLTPLKRIESPSPKLTSVSCLPDFLMLASFTMSLSTLTRSCCNVHGRRSGDLQPVYFALLLYVKSVASIWAFLMSSSKKLFIMSS